MDKKKSGESSPLITDPPAALQSVDDVVRMHLAESAKAKEPAEGHLLLTEHAEAAGLQPWQVRTLCARFHAHGLHVRARLNAEVFAAALHEALHGRV